MLSSLLHRPIRRPRRGVACALGMLAGCAGLSTGLSSAFAQATAPPGTFNVSDKAIFAAPSVVGGDPERVADGLLNTGWFMQPAATPSTTTGSFVWTVPTDFPMSRVDLRNDPVNRFRQVTVTIRNKAGAIVLGPTLYNESSGWGSGTTLQIPLSQNASTIRLDFENAASSSIVGFLEMWVWTQRPGMLDPLGGPTWLPNQTDWFGRNHEAQVRDDEVVLFNNNGTTDTAAALTQSPLPADNWRWDVKARGNTSNSTIIAADSGRVLGDAVEQVVVVRKPNNGTDPFRLELMSMFEGQNTNLGTYTFSPANRDSDVNVVVGEFDDGDHPELPDPYVRDGRRCAGVAVCYEVVGSDNQRRVRIDLLNWTNLSREDIASGTARTPILLASHVLNTGSGSTGNVGRLLHQDGTPNRIRMEYARFPNAGSLIVAHGLLDGATRRVSLAAISPYGIRTNATPLGGILRAQDMFRVPPNSARQNNTLDAANGFEDTWELVVGRFTRFDANNVNIGGDNVAVITAQGATGNPRIDVATWEGDNQGFSTLRFRAQYNGAIGDDIAGGAVVSIVPTDPLLHTTSIKALALENPANPTVQRTMVVMYHTNRGPIVQTYGTSLGNPPAPLAPGSVTWPTTTEFNSRGTFTAPTSADFMAGTVPFDRGNLGNAPGSEVRLFIKDSGSRNSLVQLRYPTTNGQPMSTAPQASVSLLNSSGGSATYNNVLMLKADIDGDSAWHEHTNAGSTLRLGMGSRLGFNNVATPRIILAEPPRHADYMRSSHSVDNVSRKSEFNAQFTHQTTSTRAFERSTEVSTSTSTKTTGSISETASVEVPGIAPAVTATETATYTNSVASLASATGTRVVGGSTTITDTQTFNTSAGDQIVFRNRDFDMWNYPVMGFPAYTTPIFNFELNPYLRLGVPADDRTDVVTGGTDNAAFAYQPEHIVGNILSYPWYGTNQGQTIAQARFTPRTNGFNRAGVQRTFPNTTFTQYSVGTTNATYQVQFDSSTNSSDTYSTTSTTSETDEVSVSAEVEASGSVFGGLVGVSGSVSATGTYSTETMQSFSNMSTRSLSSSVQNQYTLSVPPVSSSSRSYNFLPLMWFDKGGAARLSHLVNIPSSTFWSSNYGQAPDPALNLPRRIVGMDTDAALSTELDRNLMKSYEVRSDVYGAGYPVTPRYLSDGQLNPAFESDPDYNKSRNPVLSAVDGGGSAVDGQTLTLRVRVYNLALNRTATIASNVVVRFEAQELLNKGSTTEIGPRLLIGETTIPTIPGQENRWAQMLWNTTGMGACSSTGDPRYYRVYVILDPRNTINNEIHELLDRDNDPLLAGDTYNGTALEKGQNNLGWFPFSITPDPNVTDQAPTVTVHPVDRTRDVGTNVTFSATFQSDTTMTFEWRRNGNPLSNRSATATLSGIAGADTRTLSLTNVQLADAGNYRCFATNRCGTTRTQIGLLTINNPPPTCPADLDDGSGTGTPDGGVTIDDLLYYLDIYARGVLAADLDDGSGTGTHDGGVTIDDLLFFLVRYQAGC